MKKLKSENYYSNDFMDLVGKMLLLPDKRIDMEGILNHPWFAVNDAPTDEEINYEFNQREQLAKAALE